MATLRGSITPIVANFLDPELIDPPLQMMKSGRGHVSLFAILSCTSSPLCADTQRLADSDNDECNFPCVFGLFVQGLDIALVFAQPSLWLSFPEHAYSVSPGCHAAVFATIAKVWTLGVFTLLIISKAFETGI